MKPKGKLMILGRVKGGINGGHNQPTGLQTWAEQNEILLLTGKNIPVDRPATPQNDDDVLMPTTML